VDLEDNAVGCGEYNEPHLSQAKLQMVDAKKLVRDGFFLRLEILVFYFCYNPLSIPAFKLDCGFGDDSLGHKITPPGFESGFCQLDHFMKGSHPDDRHRINP